MWPICEGPLSELQAGHRMGRLPYTNQLIVLPTVIFNLLILPAHVSNLSNIFPFWLQTMFLISHLSLYPIEWGVWLVCYYSYILQHKYCINLLNLAAGVTCDLQNKLQLSAISVMTCDKQKILAEKVRTGLFYRGCWFSLFISYWMSLMIPNLKHENPYFMVATCLRLQQLSLWPVTESWFWQILVAVCDLLDWMNWYSKMLCSFLHVHSCIIITDCWSQHQQHLLPYDSDHI